MKCCTGRCKKIGLTVGLFTLIAAVGGLVGCTPKGPEERMNWVAEKISDKLDLNKVQEGKLEDLMNAIKEQRKAHKAEFQDKHKILKEMILSENLNEEEVKALLQRKQKSMAESLDAVYPALSAFHASLSPEQKKEAVQCLEKFTSKWHND